MKKKNKVRGKRKIHSFGSAEATFDFLVLLDRQAGLINKIFNSAVSRKNDVWQLSLPLLWAMVDSSTSLPMLARFEKMRDCMVISRGILETAVNILFIHASGKTMAKKAYRHYMQKSYRSFEKDAKFKNKYLGESIHFSGNLKKSRSMNYSFKEFTRKRGREVFGWTPLSVQERISMVGAKYGEWLGRSLSVTYESIYEDSSEIIHGSFYGAMLALGGAKLPIKFGPTKNLRDFKREYIQMVLFLVSVNLNSVIKILGKELKLYNCIKESQTLFQDIKTKYFGE